MPSAAENCMAFGKQHLMCYRALVELECGLPLTRAVRTSHADEQPTCQPSRPTLSPSGTSP